MSTRFAARWTPYEWLLHACAGLVMALCSFLIALLAFGIGAEIDWSGASDPLLRAVIFLALFVGFVSGAGYLAFGRSATRWLLQLADFLSPFV
jgi:hypothetical protein